MSDTGSVALDKAVYYSQTATEIIGLFSPAGGSFVSFGAEVPPEAIAAHENGHRILCTATSAGQYVAALGILANRADNADARGAARQLCVEASRQCWMVQEGFATYRQLDEYRKLGRDDLVAAGANHLPASYQAALELFRYELADDELRDFQTETGEKMEAARQILDTLGERLAVVLAVAAMGTPLAAVIEAAETFPALPITLALRRDAPDARQEILLPSFTPSFRNHCRVALLAAIKKAIDGGRTRPIDEAIDQLASELCHVAGIGFERSDRISVTQMLRKAGLDGAVEEVDARDLDTAMSVDVFSTHSLIAGTDLGFAIEAPLDLTQAKQLAGAIWENPAAGHHVICEIGSPTHDGRILAFLHCFVTKEGYVACLDRSERAAAIREFAALDPEVSVNLGIISIAIAKEEDGAARLKADFSHASWHWIASPEVLKNHPASWSLSALAQLADVTTVPLLSVHEKPAAPENIYIVPSFFAGAKAFTARGYRDLEMLPDNLRIGFYPPNETDSCNIQRARLFMASSAQSERGKPPRFHEACIASALYQGFYSQVARIIKEGNG
jgi:hypothetical protein